MYLPDVFLRNHNPNPKIQKDLDPIFHISYPFNMKTSWKQRLSQVLIFLTSSLLLPLVGGCHIQGYDSGECMDMTDFEVTMPFCANIVKYRACVPTYQRLWYNHSRLTKDRWVEKLFNQTVTERMLFETNETLLDSSLNEWNEEVEILPRFTENSDCVNAYRNYFCWINFPRCDAEGRSLLLCRSVCENFFTACGYARDLWRCGEPKYVDGYEPEVSEEMRDNELMYFRAPFPGSPLRTNEFVPETTTPLIVCTPSLENGVSLMTPILRNKSFVGMLLLSLLSWL